MRIAINKQTGELAARTASTSLIGPDPLCRVVIDIWTDIGIALNLACEFHDDKMNP